nr:MAG TPA: hypothetical protein [Caudoviricetes sp.]
MLEEVSMTATPPTSPFGLLITVRSVRGWDIHPEVPIHSQPT